MRCVGDDAFVVYSCFHHETAVVPVFSAYVRMRTRQNKNRRAHGPHHSVWCCEAGVAVSDNRVAHVTFLMSHQERNSFVSPSLRECAMQLAVPNALQPCAHVLSAVRPNLGCLRPGLPALVFV